MASTSRASARVRCTVEGSCSATPGRRPGGQGPRAYPVQGAHKKEPRRGAPGPFAVCGFRSWRLDQGAEHPAAYLVRKQLKSATFRTGGCVLPSQLAYGSPAEYLVRKQE